MNYLFPFPFYNFLKITSANGGIRGRGWRHTMPWLMKTLVFEPLRWIEVFRYQKQLQQHTITTPPVFILGYYRSGTTYLQQLFMQDNRLGFTSSFQMVFPEIMLGFEKAFTPALEKVSRLFNIQNPVHRVPLTWYSPGEEDVAMTTSLHPMAAQWGYFFPQQMPAYFNRYVLFEGLAPQEKREWEKAYLSLIKKLSLANGCRRLVLKSPPNTARIKVLLSLFPDAKFVFLHRNPYEVFASNRRLWAVVKKNYTLGRMKGVDPNSLILSSYEKMTQRYLAERSLIPAGNLIELPYETMIQQPVESMRQVYDALQLGEYRLCENSIATFAGLQKTYKRLNHQLSEGERKVLTERWGVFIREWQYDIL